MLFRGCPLGKSFVFRNDFYYKAVQGKGGSGVSGRLAEGRIDGGASPHTALWECGEFFYTVLTDPRNFMKLQKVLFSV